MSNENCFVGQVRPSQILWTYGPGALVDLPNLSVITMGLDYWRKERCTPIHEERLLNAVRRVIGPQVQELMMPPVQQEELVDFHSAEAFIGVPVKPFPRWLRCVKCGLLAEYDSGLFEIKENLYRPEQTHFVHSNCPKGKMPMQSLLAFCWLVSMAILMIFLGAGLFTADRAIVKVLSISLSEEHPYKQKTCG